MRRGRVTELRAFRYYPALDGLRGVAVILVLGYHLRIPGFSHGGATGVGMFFALSGYLITRLLLEERARSGAIDYLGFYVRRARRLLPALGLMVAVLVGSSVPLGTADEVILPAIATVLYVGNWAYWLGWVEMGPLTHTWTLGVEEQFYAVWPAVVAAASSSAYWLKWSGLALAVVLALILGQGGFAVAAGSVMAYLSHRGSMPAVPQLVGVAALLILLAPSLLPVTSGPGVALVGIATVPLIGVLVRPTGRLQAAFSARLLVRTGKISYALYLWHVPLTWYAVEQLDVQLPDLGTTVVLVAATFGAALISWIAVEVPFSRRRLEPALTMPATQPM